jgi:hypothetical protein
MRKIGSLNAFSEKYLQKFQLKPGQVVEYKLLNGKKNDDPDTAKQRPMNYPRTTFSLKGAEAGIFDTELKRRIPCGILRSYDVTAAGEIANAVWEKYIVDSPDGVFALVGGQGINDEIYFMLEHHPENEATPQDPNFPKKFKKIDKVADSKAKIQKNDQLLEALDFIKQLEVSEIQEFAQASGWNAKEDPSVLYAMMQEMAMQDPAKFLARANDRRTAIMALVRKALSENVIGYSPVQNKFTWAGTDDVIAQFEKADGVVAEDMLADYLYTGGKETEAKMNQMKRALGLIVDKSDKK